ncbi:MAG: hypothetical protein ABUL69_05150, partial [Peristeroidobacter soli]
MLEELERKCADAAIGRLVSRALYGLLHDDFQLLSNDAAERTIAAALMVQLAKTFPNWNVDVEYNKMGDAAKKVAWN